MDLDPQKYRGDFPILQSEVNRERLVYLDNAATTQKPERVIDRIKKFYREENSNVGRSIHELSNRSTEAYEDSRKKVSDLLSARKDEIVFTRNTTESMNIIAQGLELDGKIVLSEMSHHSEQLPFRRKAEREDLKTEFIPTSDGKLDVEAAKNMIDEDTSLISISHISNVFGCRNPVRELIELAKDNDAYIVVDAAQSAPRIPIDVRELDVDFLAFSGHKMCGPTGTGVLYGRKKLLEAMNPLNVGGGMIESVQEDSYKYGEVPGKFEAGTPNIAGVVGLAEATDYVQEVGLQKIDRHERKLNKAMVHDLREMERVSIYSPPEEIPSVVSFTVEDAHPHDISEVLNRNGIAVRAGHHCAQPQHQELGLSGTVRASPYLYNTEEEVQKLVKSVKKATEIF